MIFDAFTTLMKTSITILGTVGECESKKMSSNCLIIYKIWRILNTSQIGSATKSTINAMRKSISSPGFFPSVITCLKHTIRPLFLSYYMYNTTCLWIHKQRNKLDIIFGREQWCRGGKTLHRSCIVKITIQNNQQRKIEKNLQWRWNNY